MGVTLFVTPVFFTYFEGGRRKIASWRRSGKQQEPPQAATPPPAAPASPDAPSTPEAEPESPPPSER
jgi:hypothetical protein